MTETPAENTPPKNEPKVFDKCPHCGSTARITDEPIKKLLEDGEISPATPLSDAFHVQLVDQEKMKKAALFSINGLVNIKIKVFEFAVCNDCGAFYCTKFSIIDQPAQAQFIPNQPPPKMQRTLPRK
jgi:hypothetical protein